MAYLFSSESVSEGHPDKVADQISDALLDQFLAYDEHARCAIETFNTTGQVIIMGEVRYNSLLKTFPEEAKELFAKTEQFAKLRYEGYKKLSEGK